MTILKRVHMLPGIGINVMLPKAAVSAGPWWDPNSEGLCVIGAYRAKGAGNYANSRVNQANPGVNDLAEVAGAVAWVDGVGWQFTAINDNCLDTGWTPQNDQSQSLLCQFTNRANAGRVMGLFEVAGELGLQPSGVRYANGAGFFAVPLLNNGNVGLAGPTGYRNGVADPGAAGAWVGIPALTCFIGGMAFGAVAIGEFSGQIQAAVIYDCVLTGPQMLSVAGAMAAL